MQSWRVSKCRISTYAKTPRSKIGPHILYIHTHTPVHSHPALYKYLPYQDVILGRVGSWNRDSLLRCEAITWSNRAQLITWTRDGSATSHFLLRPSWIKTVAVFFTTHSCQRPLTTLILHTQGRSALVIDSFSVFSKQWTQKSIAAIGQSATMLCQQFCLDFLGRVWIAGTFQKRFPLNLLSWWMSTHLSFH